MEGKKGDSLACSNALIEQALFFLKQQKHVVSNASVEHNG